MEQTTVRLPPDLKEKIIETGRPTSDVIRDALREYFRQDTRPASVDFVRQCIEDHLRTYHARDAVGGALVMLDGLKALSDRAMAKQTGQISKDQANEPAPDQIVLPPGHLPGHGEGTIASQETVSGPRPGSSVVELQQNEMAKSEKSKLDKREMTIAALETLLDFFDIGIEPVSKSIAEVLGIDPKVVGRILYSTGMESANTRIKNISARYWRYDCQPIAEEELKKLKLGEDLNDDVIGSEGQES